MTTLNPQADPLWTKPYILLSISNFLMFISLQMLIPTLPVYVQSMGASNLLVGLTVSFFAASALIARPVTGALLDKFGRKRILLAGLIWIVLSSFNYFWISTIFLILILRILHGLSWGVSTTSMSTTISDIVPATRRGEGLGYFGLSVTFSLATAPYFGLWVMHLLGSTWMFAISSGAAVLSLLMAQSVEFPAAAKRNSQAQQKRKLDMLEKRALLPAFLAFLFMSAYSSVEVFIALFANEKHIANAGPFFLVLAGAMFVVRPLAGKLFDRVGAVWIVTPGIVIMIAGILLLSYAQALPSLLIAGAVCGAGMSAVMPSLQAWTVNRVPSHRIGAANGTYFSGIDLGFSVGSSVNSAIAQITSFTVMYRIISLYLVLLLGIYIFYQLQSGKAKRKLADPSRLPV